MKVFVVICILFAVAQANPQFRALRARASGLGGGGVPPTLPPNSPLAQALNQAQPQPQQAFRPTYQAQPQYQQYRPQAQPQYQQYQAPFGGFQPAQG